MSKTGLAAQFGFGIESTFGTRVVPTRFLEIREESLQLQIERIESESLRAGRRVQRHWIANRKGASGSVTLEVPSKGLGSLLEHLLGTIATAQPMGSTLAYDHTATLGDLDGDSLTLQVGRPDLGGTVRPFDYLGTKVVEWEISNEVDGIVLLNLTFDSQDEDTAQSLAAASYSSSFEPLTYVGGTLDVGGSQVDVRDISITGSNGLKTDRYYIRGDTLKKEQIEDTEARNFEGSFTADFEDLTLYNNYVNGTEAALTALWATTTEIESGFNYELEVLFDRVRFDGETPTVDGPDVLDQPIAFKALQPSDDSSAIEIRYRTSDATP